MKEEVRMTYNKDKTWSEGRISSLGESLPVSSEVDVYQSTPRYESTPEDE